MALACTSTEMVIAASRPASSSLLLALPQPTSIFDSENIITLLVGDAHKKITVHEKYITRASEFFTTALKKEWVEGLTRTVTLPTENPVHLGYYLEWVYNNKLPTAIYRGKGLLFGTYSQPVLPNDYNHVFVVLAHLYVLEGRMVDKTFRKSLLDEMIRIMDLRLCQSAQPALGPPPGVVEIVYKGTISTSPARRLLVDWSLAYGEQLQYSMLYKKDFLLDLAIALSGKVESSAPYDHFRGVRLRREDYVL